MPESDRSADHNIPRKADRCAGVRGCAADLPARGVRVCGCVYTAHHTPVPSTTQNPGRCAEPKSRTPTTDPEPVGPLAANHLDQLAEQQADDLAARRRLALDRLRRTTRQEQP